MNYPLMTIDVPEGTIIKKIYHISDIHINLYKKHDEYIQVFQNLYHFFNKEKEEYKYNDYEAIIVVTGDILHSKTELSPECVQLTSDFFNNLSMIMPVLIIAGNHDANLSNKNRLDALSPIIGKFDAHPNIPLFYLKDTGIYKMANISFGVTSVFDYYLLKANEIPDEPDMLKIALFHGRVNGAVTDMGAKLDGEEVVISDSESDNEEDSKINKLDEVAEDIVPMDKISPKSFDGYHYTLLGDIHKHQYLNKEKTIAYAGSLIQQNHGEGPRNHGVLVWNLETGESDLKEIKNEFGYHTIRIKNMKHCLSCCLPNLDTKYLLNNREDCVKVESYIKNGETHYRKIKDEYKHNILCPIPKKVRIRIEYDNLNYTQQQKIISLLKLNHEIIETQFKPFGKDELETQDQINKMSFNVKDVKCQNDFLDKYFNNKEKMKDKLTNEQMDEIKTLNEELNKDLSIDHIDHNNWKLCKLEFSNMFSYGSDNHIDFTKCGGIVGIVAPNHTGKSAIIDIILYCLFNKFSRKGDVKDMVNIKSDSFKAYLVFQIGNQLFHIIKSGEYKKTKSRRTGELPVKVDFYKTDLNGDKKESLKETKPKDTMIKILDYVGTYDDMILTSVSLQDNNTNFIDITDTPRKNEMEKLLKIDIFTDLKDKASKIINEKRTLFKYLKESNVVDEITELVQETQEKKDKYKKLKDIVADLEIKFEKCQIKHDKLKNNFMKLENQSNTELWNDIVAKFRLGQIGFQIPKSDVKLIRDDNEDIYNLYQQYETQWKEIPKIDKLDWPTLQKHIKDIRNILVDMIKNMDDTKSEIEIDEEMTVDQLKEDIEHTQSKLSKLHSSLTPMNDMTMDDYKEKMENIKLEKVELENKIKDLPDNETTIINNIEEASKSLKEYTNKIHEIEQNRDELMEELQTGHDEIIERDKQRIINDIKQMIISLDNYLDEEFTEEIQTSLVDKMNNVIEKVDNFGIDTSIAEEIDELNTTIKKCNKKVKKYQKLKNDAEAEKNKLEQTKQKLSHKIQKLEWQYEDSNKMIGAFSQNDEINKKINSKEKRMNKLQILLNQHILSETYQTHGMSAVTLVNTINKFLTKIKSQESDFVRYRSLKKELAEEGMILKKLKDDRDKTKEAYYQLKSDIKTNANKITDLTDKKDEIQKIEHEIKLYQNYLEAVRNIPYMLIQSVKPKLEQMINEMLSTLVDFTIYFDIKDNKHISIYIKRESESFRREVLLSNASGFEKFIGGLFIRIALINISNLPKPNFLFIDEGWGCFDGNNINNVGMIFDYLKGKFDFILTVSHLQELRQHLDQHIILKKENGFSSVHY